MAISNDFQIDTHSKVIRYVGTSGETYTMPELYNWITEQFCLPEYMDSEEPLTCVPTGSAYKLQHGWTLDGACISAAGSVTVEVPSAEPEELVDRWESILYD
jgi:hypothetical protein